MLRATPMLMGGGAGGITLPQTVFAASLYTGIGNTPQVITDGLDHTTPHMTWYKARSQLNSHCIWDTARGITPGGNTPYLITAGTGAEAPARVIDALSTTGFTIPSTAFTPTTLNQAGETGVFWSFRQAPKFFQIVTYTGDGTTGRQIPHTLGVAPGMVVVKQRSTTGNWIVYHRQLGATQAIYLNLTNAADTSGAYWNSTAPTASAFTLGGAGGGVNDAGVTYVAYLWASDPDPSGIISCGSFTTDASGNASVNLGWSPQFLLQKCSSAVSDWALYDTARGFTSAGSQFLAANTSGAEAAATIDRISATGFSVVGLSANATFVYLAIRAPIFTGPTRPQDAFATSLVSGNGGTQSVTTGFAPDMVWGKTRNTADPAEIADRVRGASKRLVPSLTNAEVASGDISAFGVSGFTLGSAVGNLNASGASTVAWSFVRKPKFFDVVTYTGDGTSGRQIAHALGVAPGMVVGKRLDAASDWPVFHGASSGELYLNQTAAQAAGRPNITTYSATTFTVTSAFNVSGARYAMYLWAHDPSPDGIVQAGSFAFSGADVAVPLGWRPQFVMVKNITTAGNWIIFDTTRGWTSAAAYMLNPNLSVAETSGVGYGAGAAGTGFTINPPGSAGTYVYLAIREPTT